MRFHRFPVLCISAMIVLWSCSNGVHAQLVDKMTNETTESRLLRAELANLVQDRRAQVQTIDLTYTSQLSKAVYDDTNEPLDNPSWRAMNTQIVHVKYQGEKFFFESTSWRNPGESPSHHLVSIYDGKRTIRHNVLAKTASIAEGYSASWLRDRFHAKLRWSRLPDDGIHPRRYLTKVFTRSIHPSPPITETIHGVETVVLGCGLDKIWLDVEHGGIVRRIEERRSLDGPLFSRTDIVEVRDVNGVFFPTKIVEMGFADETRTPKEMWNTPARRRILTVPEDGLRINCRLTQEDFDPIDDVLRHPLTEAGT